MLEFNEKLKELWETITKPDGIIMSRCVSDTTSTDENVNEFDEELTWFYEHIEEFSEEEKQSLVEMIAWFNLSMLPLIGLDNKNNDVKALFISQEYVQDLLDEIENKYQLRFGSEDF